MKLIEKKLIPYSIILVVVFYFIPISRKVDTRVELMITLLIFLNPLACLGTGAIFGLKHGFEPYFLLLITLLFIPSVFIFYNSSAILYFVLYLFFSAAGLGIGCGLRKFRKA
ncbi:hypothetical protein [Clostridium sp.]|uniref:hypothetical protein n=1 Tax=Clostridium sp. TaxID=1506 RepID=UPI003D6D6706